MKSNVALIIMILGIIVMYLGLSFICWSFNPNNWDILLRVVYVIMSIIWIFMVAEIYAKEKESK